jgi:phage shock protein PspC (stress-responsive transcriptional regulator)
MAQERDKLKRQNGIVAGVCGGLGAFFGIGPWWFRLLFLILLVPGGLPGTYSVTASAKSSHSSPKSLPS